MWASRWRRLINRFASGLYWALYRGLYWEWREGRACSAKRVSHGPKTWPPGRFRAGPAGRLPAPVLPCKGGTAPPERF
jgi:hypothetical protein